MERDSSVVNPATPSVPVLEELTSVASPVTSSVPPIVVLLRTARPYVPIVEKTERPP